MSSVLKSPLEFAKYLEATHCDENEGIWRYSHITPASVSTTGKKEYHYEMPKMGQIDIKKKRGWAKTPKDHPHSYVAISIYLKYVPNLYCIDFDTKELCNEDNDFWDYCRSERTIQVDTINGSHFYFFVPDMPEFTCSTKLSADTKKYGDIDILGRKGVKGQMNVVEKAEHPIVEVDGGGYATEPTTIAWKDLECYLDTDRMNKKPPTKKEKDLKKSSSMGNMAICGDAILDEEAFVGYLERLDSVERFHYKDWMDVGFICYNNWEGGEMGLSVWFKWTQHDPNLSTEHSHRTMEYLMEKWKTMGGDSGGALKWQSLRYMANKDDKSISPYQEIYDVGGCDAVVRYMNDFLFFNKQTSEVIFLDPEDTSNDRMMSIKKDSDAKLVFRPHWVLAEIDGKKIQCNPYAWWAKSRFQHQICKVIFDPSPAAPTNCYNLWRGFEIEQDDLTEMSLAEANVIAKPLLDHIWVIWCNKDPELFDYTMCWFAHLLQMPWRKVSVMLCVLSKQGAGKGIVLAFMEHILGGSLYAQIDNVDMITGSFNPILEGKLLINCDEAFWGGDKKISGTLKQIITEPFSNINEKHRKSYKVKSSVALCTSTNELRGLTAEEGDRRHFGCELQNTWAGKQKTPAHTKYFCNISGNHGQNGMGVSDVARENAMAFAKILFLWDISKFNPKNPPDSEYLDDQKQRNWKPSTKWWHSVLCNKQFTIGEQHKKSTWKTDTNGEKSIVPFDNRILEWGFIDDESSNGAEDTTFDWFAMEPLTLTYKLYSNKISHHRQWVKVAWYEWCEGIEYDWGDVDYKKLPIPWCALHYATGLWHEKCESMYGKGNTDAWTISIPQKEAVKHSCTTPPLSRTPIIKMRDQIDPEEDDFWFHPMNDEDQGCELVSFDAHTEGYWEKHMRGIREDDKIQLFPRLSGDFMEGNDLAQNLAFGEGNRPIYKQHICSDVAELDSYIAKWEGGVNVGNFYDDLITRNNFKCRHDEGSYEESDIKPLTNYEKRKCYKYHLYDKNFLWHKYEQSVGLGYGSNVMDAGEFWKDIKAMMGGGREDGGSYKSQRVKSTGIERRQMLHIVPIPQLRKDFEKWAGRKVKWGEDEDEDVEIDIHNLDSGFY